MIQYIIIYRRYSDIKKNISILIGENMKYFLFTILIFFIFGCIVNEFLRIYSARSWLKNQQKAAQLDYQIIKRIYTEMMLYRKLHYEANFYRNHTEKQKVQKECRENYEESFKMLETYKIVNDFMQYLTETEQNEIRKILESPKYELY